MMQCENCGSNEATVHYTHIEKNEMRNLHLCESCAIEKGLQPGTPVGNFPLTDFIAQMSRAESAAGGPCAYCGQTLDDFKKSGRLGCSHCYVTFETHLNGLLRRLHNATQHVGKVYLPPDPAGSMHEERLAGLRRRLDHAIRSEDYERAAELRDQIRQMEGV